MFYKSKNYPNKSLKENGGDDEKLEKNGGSHSPSGKMEPCAIIWWLANWRPTKLTFHLQIPKTEKEISNV